MSESFLKASIIYATFNIKKHNLIYNTFIDDTIRYLKSGSSQYANFDYSNGKLLGDKIGWNKLLDINNTESFFRFCIKHIAITFKPFWFKIAYLGRKRVFSILSEDQLQCFNIAGLTTEIPSEDIIQWWEDIYILSREINNLEKLELGKLGELKTIELENKRLKNMGIDRVAKRVSIDDNCLGYDVLSYRLNNNDIVELKIEVKSYSFGVPHFYISLNEWLVAENNTDNFMFYIWNISSDSLLELSPKDISEHIPDNNGCGSWQSIKISLNKE
ncbi:MAG: DUF3883 domain-containing protein [Clostridium sp.]|uniref:DUF3883 domain-containing protein n=1 Tax=Clostridium TaxID=1485 RepID=UPI002900D9A2|nr:DUF3883 domain-containing protein [Clostridium sp.]MDU1280011.1 DUF3883 domain-containing protein [Clostridium sp.]MDU7089076.1 DUF3883 domain-containing protein [Clostridium sp.]